MTATLTITTVDAVRPRRGHRSVQVLNASYQPLRPVTLHRAVNLLARGAAVVDQGDGERFLRSSTGEALWPWPTVVRLVRLAKVAYEHVHNRPQRWSKRGVLDRDGRRCAYCHAPRADTVDHVVPRAAGGRSEWLNTVAACAACNGRKRDRTPAQAGMKLLLTPYVPRRTAGR